MTDTLRGGLPATFARVLVTGGSGFVGGHLVDALRRAAPGATLVLAGREPGCDVHLDLNDAGTIAAAVRTAAPDLVFHLAGEASVAAASRDAASMWRTGLAGSLALAEVLGEVSPAATLVFASSAEVYGQAFLDGTVDETTVPHPQSAYGEVKLATERMLAAVLPVGATLIVARPSNHIGPGQQERFALPSFAAQLAAGERTGSAPVIRVGNLDAERDFLDVRDVVGAYIALARRLHATGGRHLFNIASGRTRSVGTLLDILREAASVESTVEVDPTRLRADEIPRAAVGAALLAAALGWSPSIAVEQSIRDILQDARDRPVSGEAGS